MLYVSFGSKVRPRTFGCIAMGSVVLFILRYRSLVYSAGSGVNRVQVVLSGFSVILLCFVQAYDTVNHRLLIQKFFNITQDSTLCSVIRNLLSNRRFYVELNNERSRWRLQKNGLPQGSVLSPTLFQNIHQ